MKSHKHESLTTAKPISQFNSRGHKWHLKRQLWPEGYAQSSVPRSKFWLCISAKIIPKKNTGCRFEYNILFISMKIKIEIYFISCQTCFISFDTFLALVSWVIVAFFQSDSSTFCKYRPSISPSTLYSIKISYNYR